ncbi:MAG TPA: HDOD domain-containing protein [Phycisphaerae bacterium]
MARTLQDRLIHSFDRHNLSLPPLPQVPLKVLTHLRDPKCSFSQISKDIAQDPVIAGAVLRMANSAIYAGAQRITTLPPAVTRLGSRVLRMLMLHQSLRAAAFDIGARDRDLAEKVWVRAVASAAVMSGLARLIGCDEDEALLVGLFHDVGNVIVLREAAAQAALSRQRVEIDAFEYLAYQCHQELGEMIAQEWQLSEDLRSLIADHHHSPAADDLLGQQRWLIQLSDMLIATLGYAPGGGYDAESCQPARELGLAKRADFVSFLERLPEAIQQVLTMV